MSSKRICGLRHLLFFILCTSQCAHATDEEVTTIFVRGLSQEFKQVSFHELGTVQEFNEVALRKLPTLTTDSFLQSVPGFSLFRRSPSIGAHPTGQGVSLRGTGTSGASRTLVLLDGIPINDAFGGWVQWARVPQDNLARIRVQENWGSHHFSYLGLESSIEMQTKEPEKSSAGLTLSGGNLGTTKVSGFLTGTQKELSWLASGQGFRTQGFVPLAKESRGPIDDELFSEHAVGLGKINYHLTQESSLYFLSNNFIEDRGGGTKLTDNESRSSINAIGGTIKVPSEAQIRFNVFTNRGGFASRFSSQSSDRTTESPASDQYFVPSTTIGADFDFGQKTSGRNFLELGADALWRDGESNENFRFSDGAFQSFRESGGEQSALGLYAFNRYQFLDPFTLDTFLRLNTWSNLSLFRREGSRGAGSLYREDSNDGTFHSYLEPRIQITYEFSQSLSMRGSVTRGARIPTINELVRPFRVRNDITEANPGLDPEEIRGHTLDLIHEIGALKVTLSAFYNQLLNPIINATVDPAAAEPICGFVPEGGACRQRRNIGEATTAGAEILGRYQFTDSLSGGLGYLFSKSKVEDAAAAREIEDNELPQTPMHQASLTAGYEAERFSISTRMRFVGRQYEDDLNNLPLKSFVTVDVASTWQLEKNLQAFFMLENIFNKRYEVGRTQDNLLSISPPLLAQIGLRVKF